jgi:hypothetical protein
VARSYSGICREMEDQDLTPQGVITEPWSRRMGLKQLPLSEVRLRRAFRDEAYSIATQGAAWRYEADPGILLTHARRRRF